MSHPFVSIRLALTASLVLTAPSCGHDVPTTATEPTGGAPPLSSMSARAEGESWNPVYVNARRLDDYLLLDGTAWVGDEGTLVIRLKIRAVAGASPQLVDSSRSISADVVYDPLYQPQQSWTAFGTTGAGTFVINSLSETRATGTFSFTARAVTANSVPRDYRVTEGTFDVRF